jgi:aminomethyltransferase
VSDTYNPEEPQAEPELLPLDAWHRGKGARMVPFAGYAMPIQYEGIMAEHLWVRENAGLFDVSHMGQLMLSGDSLDDAIEALIPADVKGLALGQLRYSMLLDDSGGILDDLIIARWPDKIYMVVNGATKWDDIAHMREHLPDHITLNHLDGRGLLALQGPKAFDVLARHAAGKWPLAALSFMRGGPFSIAGADVWISRSGYTGEDGFELSFPVEAMEQIAGLFAAQPEVKPIGLGARDSLRLEAGLPLYGHDLDMRINPVQADLAFAISRRRRAEGGFPGAEPIRSMLSNGPPSKRIGFLVEGRQPVREGALVYAGDLQVGVITSGGFAPSVGAPIAMGYVATAHLSSPLEAEVRGKRIRLTSTPMPFIPHRYVRKGASK